MRLQTETGLLSKRAGICALELANLCVCEHVWDTILHYWEQPGLRYSLTGTEWGWGGSLRTGCLLDPEGSGDFVLICVLVGSGRLVFAPMLFTL